MAMKDGDQREDLADVSFAPLSHSSVRRVIGLVVQSQRPQVDTYRILTTAEKSLTVPRFGPMTTTSSDEPSGFIDVPLLYQFRGGRFGINHDQKVIAISPEIDLEQLMEFLRDRKSTFFPA